MSLFILDTDTLTLFERNHPIVCARIAAHPPNEIAISVVTVEGSCGIELRFCPIWSESEF